MAITNAPLGRREFAFFFVVYNYLLHRTAGFVNNQILPIVLGSIRNKHEKFVGRNIFGRTFGVTQNLFFIFKFPFLVTNHILPQLTSATTILNSATGPTNSTKFRFICFEYAQ